MGVVTRSRSVGGGEQVERQGYTQLLRHTRDGLDGVDDGGDDGAEKAFGGVLQATQEGWLVGRA
ncbi:MAG: hypothetical protein ACRD0G_13665 [Acidimicrobiales bacterium]